MVEKQWELFIRKRCFPLRVAAAQARKRSDFMLLRDDLLKYLQLELTYSLTYLMIISSIPFLSEPLPNLLLNEP